MSEELVHKYKHGTKEDKQMANKAVIDLVLHGLRGCTIQAKDVQTLHLFRALRRLFVPKGTRLSVAHNVALTQVRTRNIPVLYKQTTASILGESIDSRHEAMSLAANVLMRLFFAARVMRGERTLV